MKEVIIGYQGISGAYSEMAADKFVAKYKSQIESKTKTKGFQSFDEIFKQIEDGKIQFGLLPVENSLAGSVHRNVDLLNQHDVLVVGEEYVHVNHQLLVLPGTKFKEIKEVYSHWQALAQCQDSTKKMLPHAKVVEYFDTAGAAEFVRNSGDKSKAAIASVKAGELHQLVSLKNGMQDEKENFTRFLVVCTPKVAHKYFKDSEVAHFKLDTHKKYKSKIVADSNSYKTSIIFWGHSKTGFLFKCLACFSLRDINLTKIESRPIPKQPWKHFFYLDFEGSISDFTIQQALSNLSEIVDGYKILGSYKKDKQ